MRLIETVRAWRRDEDGASLVEFSLFLPMFVIGSIVAYDLGHALFDKMGLNTVLRGGAHLAMLDSGEEEREANDCTRSAADCEISGDPNRYPEADLDIVPPGHHNSYLLPADFWPCIVMSIEVNRAGFEPRLRIVGCANRKNVGFRVD